MTTFVCNLCGTENQAELESLGREVASCMRCRSTVRLRGLIHLLSVELFGVSVPMSEMPRRKGLRGLGMSDSPDFAEALADRFSYTNTYYHKELRFDVIAMDERHFGQYDFIVSSEVMEHVPPPPERGFETLFRMLKPRGVLLLTVPYTLEAATHEHFPELHDFNIAELRSGLVLINRTRDGRIETFDNLVFHGGGGSTLEMRRYSERALREILTGIGFSSVRIAAEPCAEFGVPAHENWSLPIAARKGAFVYEANDVAELVLGYREMFAKIRGLKDEIKERVAETDEIRTWMINREKQLTADLIDRTKWAERLEKQLEERTAWARSLEKDLDHHVDLATKLKGEFDERSEWALKLQEEAAQARAELEKLRSRRWVKIGRNLGRV